MTNLPTPLILRQFTDSMPYLTHNHPATPSIPIPQLPSMSNSPPSTGTSTYLQTPAASPAPPPANSAPKGFPHNADLLGSPSESRSIPPDTPSVPPVTPLSETPFTPARVARVRERLATRRAERAVETLSHQRSHSRHIFDTEPVVGPSAAELSRQAQASRIAPRAFRLPDEYVPTPASLSFGDAVSDSPTFPSFESIAIPSDARDAFRLFAEPPSVPPPRPHPQPQGLDWQRSLWDDGIDFGSVGTIPAAATPLVSMWNQSIQQTVDRRLPVEPQRDARMAPHLGDGYSQARIAAMDALSRAQASEERLRLAAVAGPGGMGDMWGEIPDTPPVVRAPPSHPYLRHRDRILEMDDSFGRAFLPPPYRTFPGNMDWYDYDAISDAPPYLFHTVNTPRALGESIFREGQSVAEQKVAMQALARTLQRLPPSSRRKAAESMVHQVKWDKNCEETICAVCHDEYEPDSCISVTPCKHMYHKDCLNVWLDQPLISSCPMCRRDLAVLACVERMLKKGKDAALALWMSV